MAENQPDRVRTKASRGIAARLLFGALLLIAAAIAIFLYLFEWNWLKRPIEKTISGATGRELVIEGDVSGTWSWEWRPQLRIEKVRLSNPDWATDPQFLTSEAIQFKLQLLPLLRKRLHLDSLHLEGTHLSLEKTGDGRSTWHFDNEQKDDSTTPVIERLSVSKGSMRIRDVASRTDISATVQEDPSAATERSLSFQAKGSLRNLQFQVQGATASLLALRNLEQALPLEARGLIADTKFAVEGTVEGIQHFERADLKYVLEGPTLSGLGTIFTAPIPNTPRYRITGRLRHGPGIWASDDLVGQIGSTDLRGAASLKTGEKQKPFLEVKLASRRMDLADLGPLVGYVGKATGSAVAPEKAKARAVQTNRILPVYNLEFTAVERINAHVVLSAQQVARPNGFPFDNFSADFRLKDSHITVDPLKLGVADGALVLKAELDARKPVKGSVRGTLKGVRMARFFEDKRLGEAAGLISGFVDLQGTGGSVAAMMGNANGRAGAVLSEGRVPALWPALADLDGARILTNLSKEKPESIVCTAIDLKVEKGIGTPTVAVVETESTVLTGSGAVNLQDETLALKLDQAPKRPSILSFRTPIRLEGPMLHPKVRLEPGPLGARAAAGIGLGLLNPLLALFATIETGPGRDGICPEMSAAVKQQRSSEPPAASRPVKPVPAASAPPAAS